MKVVALKEGDFSVSKNKEFFGLDDYPGGLRMAVQPFLVVTGTDVILLDAGLGFLENGKPQIHRLLERENIDAAHVTKVLISHFHKDHVDGLGYFDDGSFIPNFPNAHIFYQKRELDFAFTDVGNPSYDLEKLRHIAALDNLIELDGDEGHIGDSISFAVSGGHSRFHQEFWIRENGKTIFYGADNLPQKSYIDFNIAYKSDDDGKKAAALRHDWKARAEAGHWTVLLYHDMAFPIVEF
ncbi:MBL fold metallo-hydrolase [Flavobacterium selenitireducens]|uniref:MBL fold metallo-hydrolase n=1 Tax=Flavobacterium selenitireducens TaxID=2722704 RepID=UPI00168B581B|nr:MBL fold metallo-hydrolase [Flavobacterium selenitireducens]MBD3581659.1 MBL fold metallo-hydrolase [Flavobacterium selenitireducens]